MRQLKAAKAEKTIVNAAVAELLDLKKRLAAAEEAATKQTQSTSNSTDKPSAVAPANLENLTRQVAEQVELIRYCASAKCWLFIYTHLLF